MLEYVEATIYLPMSIMDYLLWITIGRNLGRHVYLTGFTLTINTKPWHPIDMIGTQWWVLDPRKSPRNYVSEERPLD